MAVRGAYLDGCQVRARDGGGAGDHGVPVRRGAPAGGDLVPAVTCHGVCGVTRAGGKPGQKITIADGDDEPHTVTADDAGFDTGSFDGSAPGSLVAPTTPGVYPVHCTVHPSMHGTLTVR